MSTPATSTSISIEALTYWYLRLNGFLTITNFVVHPDRGSHQETDVDVLGVRFPYRAENLRRPMKDDDLFTAVQDKPLIVLAEATLQPCKLNGPWTKRERGNMLRVLCAIGAFSRHRSTEVADHLYERGKFENDDYAVILLCIGRERSQTIAESHPDVPQLLHEQLLRFMFERFKSYRREKVSHPQWNNSGQVLWQCSERSPSFEEFTRRIALTQ